MTYSDELFRNFVAALTEEPDTIKISGKALGILSRLVPFDKVSLLLQIPPSAVLSDGDTLSAVLYGPPDAIPKAVSWTYHHPYSTGEQLFYTVERVAGFSDFTEDEKQVLHTAFEILAMHGGRHHLHEQLEQTALTMFLTGLPNQGGYLKWVKQIFEQQNLLAYDAYYFNLRSFGLVNRRFGQVEGDNVIRRYAEFLKAFRAPDECIGHLGGDNFVAMIRKERHEAFLHLLSEINTYGEKRGERIPLKISASVGVYRIDDKLKEPGQLISYCSIALGIARANHNQPVAYLTDEIRHQLFRSKTIEERFPAALGLGEFFVYYQPKVNTVTFEMIGAEALVRWPTDDSMIYPGEFIPVLERSGDILDLDLYVLKKVCADISRWQSCGITPVTVSVNFSRRDLSQPSLQDEILEIIASSGIERKWIQIEVTETTTEEEHGMLTGFLRAMHAAGVSTAIDDFGTGYSSLNTLRDFDVNVIKIDKSFIDNTDPLPSDKIVLQNIIHMAHQLEMDVITEGVERWSQLHFLQDLGCYMVQGYLFDKPMPVSDFELRLRSKTYDPALVRDTD